MYNCARTISPKIPRFLKRGIRVPLSAHRMSLVEIRQWSYFQNNMPVFEKNTTVCMTVYFTYSTYQKRLSEKNCVLLSSLSSSCSDHHPVVRQLGPPRSALSGSRASPPPAGCAAGRNNRRRPPLHPLPLPSPHAADPVVFGHLLLLLPPPTAAPLLSLFYMRHRRRRIVAVESGAPAGVP